MKEEDADRARMESGAKGFLDADAFSMAYDFLCSDDISRQAAFHQAGE